MAAANLIPVEIAYTTLNLVKKLLKPKKVQMEDLEDMAEDGRSVEVEKLRKFFKTKKGFTEFKATQLDVPNQVWEYPDVRTFQYKKFKQLNAPLPPSRSRSPSPTATRGRSRSPRRPVFGPAKKRGRPPTKRDKFKMWSKLGTLTPNDVLYREDNESILYIDPSKDECDDTDVNFPLPVCQGIRRVCRTYDKNRRYTNFPPDSSENQKYIFAVKYDN